MRPALLKLYYFLITGIRSQRWLAQRLFKIKIPKNIKGPYWDFTTLLMKKALREHLDSSMSVLEIGTGKVAILTAYLGKISKAATGGVDISSDFVASSRETLKLNALEKIRIVQSNLFSNVSGCFDLIFFNSVYIKSDWGNKYLAAYNDNSWNGGVSGLEVIADFLSSCLPHLKRNGSVLLGVNSFYLKEAEISSLIAESAFELAGVMKKITNPSRIYILKAKTGPRVHRGHG
jgi:methylase of polypeptide subunit release factors